MTTINIDEVAFISETSLTIRESRRRTTIPKQIVDALDLKDGDRIRWILFNDNRILITKVPKKK
ncbi:MAG: AbrB/MazE/SpoVT family DNA-binding domain-containing protein [Candidatus Lokiarchaeota archaeon]|nr:AbrB/MazE/SpoVT family DNA-binding domain-containing protein [Candidatus Harpocratesius repetitus]